MNQVFLDFLIMPYQAAKLLKNLQQKNQTTTHYFLPFYHVGDYLFSTPAKFFEKLIFLTLDT